MPTASQPSPRVRSPRPHSRRPEMHHRRQHRAQTMNHAPPTTANPDPTSTLDPVRSEREGRPYKGNEHSPESEHNQQDAAESSARHPNQIRRSERPPGPGMPSRPSTSSIRNPGDLFEIRSEKTCSTPQPCAVKHATGAGSTMTEGHHYGSPVRRSDQRDARRRFGRVPCSTPRASQHPAPLNQ